MPPLVNIQDGASASTQTRGKGSTTLEMKTEMESLRRKLEELKTHVEDVEDERNCNAAKANELQSLLNSQKKDSIHEAYQKSLQVAEMSMKTDRLKKQLRNLVAENHELRTARQENEKRMEEMSGLVRSLQCKTGNIGESEDATEVVLTPEKALDMTMRNMKVHMEALEEDRQVLAVTCNDQEKQIVALESENKILTVRVQMLEELFRSLNQKRIDESQPTEKSPRREVTRNSSLPDLFASERRKSKAATMLEPEKKVQWSKAVPVKTEAKERVKPRVLAVLSPTGPSRRSKTKNGSFTKLTQRPAFNKSNSTPELSCPPRSRSFTKRMTVRERRAAAKRGDNKFSADARSMGGTKSGSKIGKEEEQKGGNQSIRVGELEGTYLGPMKNGLPNGTGTIRFTNGDTYLGQVVDGKMHGRGTMYHSSRELGIVRGTWNSNEKVET